MSSIAKSATVKTFPPILTATARLLLIATGQGVAAAQPVTTVYVNRGYEVRPDDTPIKYVWAGDTRAARVTGSINSNTRIQRLRLYQGWNLCTIAVDNARFSPGSPLQEVYQWNSESQIWQEIQANSGLPFGAVLWIRMSQHAIVTVSGRFKEPAAQIAPTTGSFICANSSEGLPLPAKIAGSVAWSFDGAAQLWRIQLPFSRSTSPVNFLSPGSVLFVRSDIDLTVDPPPRDDHIRFYHQDHLGSTSVITDASGNLLHERAYYPFGGTRQAYSLSVAPEPYTFSQKEKDQETPLHYFETRYLASALDRFSIPDTKYIDLDSFPSEQPELAQRSPQKLNLYSYVHNNPVKYIDPTGQDSSKPKKAAVKPVKAPSLTLTLSGFSEPLRVSGYAFSRAQNLDQNSKHVEKRSLSIVVRKEVDKTSPRLHKASLDAKAMEGNLTIRDPEGNLTVRVKLKGVFIGEFRPASHDGKEIFTLYPTEIELETPNKVFQQKVDKPWEQLIFVQESIFQTAE